MTAVLLRCRRSRGRLFGLKLKLPWFGPKDGEKQRGGVVSAGKKLHHQMTCNSDVSRFLLL